MSTHSEDSRSLPKWCGEDRTLGLARTFDLKRIDGHEWPMDG